jgi:hypothetical protein
MSEIDDEKAAHEITKARLADVMGDGGSYRTLQVSLDAALQKHADLTAAHAADVESLQGKHAEEIQAFRADCARQIQAVNEAADLRVAQVKLACETELQARQMTIDRLSAALEKTSKGE